MLQIQTAPSALSIWPTIVLVLACTVTDLRDRKIPNGLTLPAVALGLILSGLGDGWAGLLTSLVGLLVGFGLMFLPYHLGGMGAGDVKLMTAVGALLGFPAIIQVFFYTALAGGALALVAILRDRTARKAMVNIVSSILSFFLFRFGGLKSQAGEAMMTKSVGSIPYGVAIALGTISYLCLGRIV